MQDIITYVLPDKNIIIHKIVKTKIAKRCINSFVVTIFSFIIKTLLYSLFSFLILFDNMYIDFFTQCTISIILCSYDKKIQIIADYFDGDFYKITRFLVNNYSNENYRKWKNYLISFVLVILYFYFYFFEINSFLIRIYILQYALCYIFMEIKDNKKNIVSFFIKEQKSSEYIMVNKKKVLPNIPSEIDIVDKKKIFPNIPSEFDIVDNVKKSNSFEILDS